MLDQIFVKGARENNLKNIDVSIPRDKLTVITGLSGSGKSSLAFDTIYAEGQRRYVESLSSYARMFLGQKEKPDVDYIDGLSPAISIDQKTTSQNPRSTVGTVTEIYDYLRLLWARVGTPHCPNCGKEIKQQTIDQIVDQVMALGEGTRIQVMAPVIRGKKGEYAKVFEDARKSGYVRVRVDGSMYDLSEEIKLEKNIKHSIEVVVDRLILKPDVVHRLSDSAETAAALSGAAAIILPPAGAGASAGVSVSPLSSAALYMAIPDSSLAVLLAPFAAKVPEKVTPAQIATAAAPASAPQRVTRRWMLAFFFAGFSAGAAVSWTRAITFAVKFSGTSPSASSVPDIACIAS